MFGFLKSIKGQKTNSILVLIVFFFLIIYLWFFLGSQWYDDDYLPAFIDLSGAYCGKDGPAIIILSADKRANKRTIDLGNCTNPITSIGQNCGDLIVIRTDNTSLNANFSKTQIAPGESVIFKDYSCTARDLCNYKFITTGGPSGSSIVNVKVQC